MTPEEILLWGLFRDRKFHGLKFLRQHPIFYRINRNKIEFFIADFYCAEFRLIIEVDGPIHDFKLNYDRERDMKLKERGYQIKRIRNEELIDLDSVLIELYDLISSLQRNSVK